MGTLKINYVEGITATRRNRIKGDTTTLFDLPIGIESESFDQQQEVVITAKLGYEIVTAKWSAGVIGSGNMTISSDNKTASQTANVVYQGSADFIFTVTTKTVPVPIIKVMGENINATVESKSFNTGLIEIPINENYIAPYNGWNYEVVVTAKDGFKIDTAEYNEASGATGFMSISEDGKTATISRVVSTTTPFNCYIETIASEPEPEPEPMGVIRVEGSNITATMEDTTMGGDIAVDLEINQDIEVPTNRNVKIVVTADEGYQIEYAVYSKTSGATGVMVISEDGKTATITREIVESKPLLCVIDTILVPIIKHSYVRVTGENVTAMIENTTLGTSPIAINLNEDVEVINGDVYKVTVTPNEDYKLSELYFITINGATGYGELFNNGSYGEVSRVVSDTRVLEVTFDLIESQPPQDIAGFNYLYVVDREQLKSIANERFTNEVDLGQYIINVLELPFKLNISEYGNETFIHLGNYQLKTRAIELLRDEITIDFGSIEVPLQYNNSYDFINTEVKLHLPYATTINLDVNYVVNQTIKIVYIIDLYTGETTINVYSSLIDNIFHSEKVSLGRDIPYITTFKGDKVNSISTNKGLTNGLLNPFIEVIRNVPYQLDNPFNTDINVQGTLLDVLGFISVNSMILETKATNEEESRIITLLRNGVYIK